MPTASPTSPDLIALSSQPIAENPAWQSAVIGDQGGLVYPVAVQIQGDASLVDNPSGLMAAGGGATTIHASGAGQPALVLDLGVETGGVVEVGLTASDGTPLLLAYSEAQRFLTPHGDTTIGSLGRDDDPDGRTDTFTPTAGAAPQAFTSPGIRGGERWVLLQLQGAGAVTIDYVRVRSTHYEPTPADYAGHFLSDDAVVNRVWYAGAYTLSLDTIGDRAGGPSAPLVLVDGAKRDRLVWSADLAVEELTAAYAFSSGEQLARDSLALFPCQQAPSGYLPAFGQITPSCPLTTTATPVTTATATPGSAGSPTATATGTPATPSLILGEYVAWYIVAAYQYYLYSGDAATLAGLMPALRRALGFLNANAPRGLYLARQPGELNWHPFDVAYGESSNTNAVYYEALHDMAALETSIAGDSAAAAADLQRAAQVQQAMMRLLWDDTAGAFLVNTFDPQRDHPQDGNVQAVVAGVLDSQDAARALAYVQQHLSTTYGTLTGELTTDPYMSQYVSPYMSFWELWARFGQGDDVTALGLLRRLYGHMVATDPNVTLWEKMSVAGDAQPYPSPVADGPGFTSLAHGWSTGATAALSAWVLGLRPTAPGYASWSIAPQPGDLRWAQGQAPTPNGPLISRWERGPGDAWFHMTAQGPGTTPGTVAVPLLGTDRTIAEDGAIVWQNGAAVGGASAQQIGDAVVFSDVSGVHTFAWVAQGTATPTAAPSSSPTATVTPTLSPTSTATAALTSSRASSGVGATVTLTGTGFDAGEQVAITWDTTATAPLTTVTAALGTFVAAIVVPQAPVGPHRLMAVGRASGRMASLAFQIKPAVFVYPTSGRAGATAYLIGVGFGADETVAGLLYPGFNLLSAATSNSLGTVVVPFVVPPSTPGLYYALGYGVTTKAYALAPFTITAVSSSTTRQGLLPAPPPTQVQAALARLPPTATHDRPPAGTCFRLRPTLRLCP